MIVIFNFICMNELPNKSKLLATHSLNYMRCFETLFELLIGVAGRLPCLPSCQKNSGSALWLEVAIEEDQTHLHCALKFLDTFPGLSKRNTMNFHVDYETVLADIYSILWCRPYVMPAKASAAFILK